MAELATGTTFADHVIRGVAGRGGMGIVYRAMHLPLKREVALKIIAPESSGDAEVRMRFRREIEVAASIQHPNVIPVYHAGEEDGLLYVTMRYVPGTDLARLLAVEGRLEPVRAAVLMAQVADALDAAHEAGVVHRDVKPANVLLDAERAVLTDFGLTKNLRSNSQETQAGTLLGTFDYTAPEQLEESDVDARTDVYALGCVLYQALTGEVPYPRDSNAARMFAHFTAAPPAVTALVPDAPKRLDAVIGRALAKDPGERYPTAGELGTAMLAAVGARRSEVGLAAADAGAGPARGIPLPPALVSEIGLGPFVGRAAPLAELEQRHALAVAGERQFVLVEGEPGIGKTRLASELARRAHADGAIVLYGRSDSESLVPYQPFIAALQHYIAHRETLALPADLEPELSELARFVPALRRHLPALHDPIAEAPETRRYRLFEAVTRLLAHIAAEHPAVLVLDDLQWADASTLLLLGHVLGDPEPTRLLVVGTTRSTSGEPFDRLLARRHRDPAFALLSLEGLDAAETEAMIAAQSGDSVSQAFVHRLHDGTEGNPFFIRETLRSLADAGERGDDREAALTRIAVPEGVKETIARRLEHLGETANQILAVAAVIGRSFRLEVLEALIDAPDEQIISGLEEAVAAGVVLESGEDVDVFLFAHALVREALYEQQSASRRVRVHHRIGEAMEAIGPRLDAQPAELAHHFLESRHLDRAGKAIEYAARAGEQASAALAHDEAAGHYRRALGALAARPDVDPRRRCELLLALGGAEQRAGAPGARATFAEAALLARGEGLRDELAQAALGFAGRHSEAGIVDREGIALLGEALEGLEGPESTLLVRVLARLAESLHFAGEGAATEALSLRAVQVAERVGDVEALAVALQSRHAALRHISHLDERLRLSGELLELAVRIGDRELEALGRHYRLYDLFEAGEIAAARGEHSALVALADALRQPLYRHFALGWEVVWAQLEDRVEDAERLAGEAYRAGRRAQARDAQLLYGSQLLTVRYRAGRLAEHVEAIQAQVDAQPDQAVYRSVLSLAYLIAGNRERGIEEFDRLGRDDFRAIPRDMFWFVAVGVFAMAGGLIGDPGRARVLYEQILPYRERNVQNATATCWGSAEYYLGLLAGAMSDYDLAAEHFELALRRNTNSGFRPLVREVRRQFATVLHARRGPGDLERAAALLRSNFDEAAAAGRPDLAAGDDRRLEQIARELAA